MKTFYPKRKTFALFSMLAIATLFTSHQAFSQSNSMSPGQAAKFGIDGDLKSDERQNGSFTATGSHDWFSKSGGSGVGLLDTTGAATLKAAIKSGQNISFIKKMQFPVYSVQDGVLLMDAVYARDYTNKDYTSFSGNNTKNLTSPLDWNTAPSGTMVSDKTDIVDAYVSMRRDGTVISGSNSSKLIATMGLATLATGGDHYIDFEFYKERIAYNSTTGKFSNSGPSTTGGHSSWEFNADGSIKNWGDLTISFSFSSSTVSDVKILIWISKSAFNSINPTNFDFVTNEFYESSAVSGYGYAAIKPNGSGQLSAWGSVNSAASAGPAWGTNSKDLGSAGSNYYSENYSVGQLAEAAVDLSGLGIDPATFPNVNACNPPFTRFMAKSRSSSSFSSALSDFTGPLEFLDAPSLPAAIAASTNLTCSASGVRLSVSGYAIGGYYNWTTSNGTIANAAVDGSYVDVNKAGTYYLTAALGQGCSATNLDSVVVGLDTIKPVATAGAFPQIVIPGQTVTLQGSDAASNFTTAFGNSSGSDWKWDGVNGTLFTSTSQNPVISTAGNYRLIVTELRNGCKDTAFISVAAGAILPVKFTEFKVASDKTNGINQLSWIVAEANDVAQFVVEKSSNGIDFKPAAYVFASSNYTAYSVKDKQSEGKVYYRIRAEYKSNAAVFSAIVKLDENNIKDKFSAFADNGGIITIRYSALVSETIKIKIVNMGGQLVRETSRNVSAGTNLIRLDDVSKPNGGVYVVILTGQNSSASAKINW